MLAIGRFLLGCLLTVQVSPESVERELLVRELSLSGSVSLPNGEGREDSRVRLESIARRARVRGRLSESELGLVRAQLASDDATLRLWALRALQSSDCPLSDDHRDAGESAQRLAEDPHPSVRVALSKLLALQADEHGQAVSILALLTEDRHPDVARAALFALLHAPEEGADVLFVERWQNAAASAVLQLLATDPPRPQTFLEAVEVVSSLRAPPRHSLLRELARILPRDGRWLGARALVEASRVEPDSSESIDEDLLLEGFLAPLLGDVDRDLPRLARRRMQRAAAKDLGVPFAEKLGEMAVLEACDLASAAREWEGVGYRLECALQLASPEQLAKLGVAQGMPAEGWEIFFDAIRGRACEFEAEVLDAWLSPARSPEERWNALRALAASWAAGAPHVRERLDRVLHGDDRELASDLFGLLARTQQKIGEKLPLPSAQQAWEETDEILSRAWLAGDRPVALRVADLDLLSRAAPHTAFKEELLPILGRTPESATASVFELCADLVTEIERERPQWPGGAGEAFQSSIARDDGELVGAALAGEDLRAIETRIRHALRAHARAEIYGWRKLILSSLSNADSVASEDVGKTAAALLVKSGPEGLELLRGALSGIELVRTRLEVLLGLLGSPEAAGIEDALLASAELRARFDRCDDELKLRILRTMGGAVRTPDFPATEVRAIATFLRDFATGGVPATQLETAAVEAYAQACEVLGSAEPLRELATALGSAAKGAGASAESALEGRLVALREIAEFDGAAEEVAHNVRYLAETLDLVSGVMDLAEQDGVEVPEAEIVRAELEREVLLPALARNGEGEREWLGAEWSRQLAGTAALATLRKRMSAHKLPRREFVLRSELAAMAATERLPGAESLLVPELDARSALFAVRAIQGQAELRRSLLERVIIAFVGEPQTEQAARFDLEARLRSLLLRIEASEEGIEALAASLRFDLASPERSAERAVELIFFPSRSASGAGNTASDRTLPLRARALRRFDNLVRTAKSRASSEDR